MQSCLGLEGSNSWKVTNPWVKLGIRGIEKGENYSEGVSIDRKRGLYSLRNIEL